MFRVANWLREKLNKMVRKIDFPSFSYTPFQQRAYTHLSFMTSQKSLFKNHLKLAHVHVAQESFHSSQAFRNFDPVRALHSEENCSVELNIQCFSIERSLILFCFLCLTKSQVSYFYPPSQVQFSFFLLRGKFNKPILLI